MKINNLFDIKGVEFPAGRLTKVIVGPGAPVEAENFVMGYVTIYPGGKVPLHSHKQEEVYLIISGKGIMHINDEKKNVKKGNYLYISPNSSHLLENISKENLIIIFCYAPKSIAEHWKQELNGIVK